MLFRTEVHSHGFEEGSGQLGAEGALSSRQGEGVHDEIGTEADIHRTVRFGLELIERAAGADHVDPGLLRSTVDDLVGDSHECVDVLNVLSNAGA